MKRKNPAAVALGRLGGSIKSRAKAKSSKANGKLGGRPKKVDQALYECRCLNCGARIHLCIPVNPPNCAECPGHDDIARRNQASADKEEV